MRKYWFILLLTLAGCTREPAVPAPEKLVIEGWIEDGGAPVVYVTTTLRVEKDKVMGSDEIQSHIVKWAKVTISDGTEEVILTGTASERFSPPYAYTTGRMFGEVGKAYTLTVEYGGETATATATIPSPAAIESISVISKENGEYLIRASFTDNPGTVDYYRFFTRIQDLDKVYLPVPLGTLSDAMIQDGTAWMDLQPGGAMFRNEGRSGFRSGEVVDVKLCTMDLPMYQYWNAFEEQFALGSVPFFSLDTNLPSNITGGLGYFAAYGASTCTVSVP